MILYLNRMVRRSLAAAFWAAAAFTLVMALLPHPPQPPGNPSDKLQHIAAFATLAALAAAAWPGRRYIGLGIALSGFGALIEFLQMIPALHRDAELLDWMADTAAITTVLLLAAAWRARSGRPGSARSAARDR